MNPEIKKPIEENEARLNTLLNGTGLTVIINETSELYEDCEEDHEDYGAPMYEAYIEDADEDMIEDTMTGRNCSLADVIHEISLTVESFVKRRFKTDDGYALRLIETSEVTYWTDGDLKFEDVKGYPVDSFGDPLDGEFIVGENQAIEDVGTKKIVSNADDFILSYDGLYYAYEHDKTPRLLGVFKSEEEAIERIVEANAGICLKDDEDIVLLSSQDDVDDIELYDAQKLSRLDYEV